jgi:VWFA-related protein
MAIALVIDRSGSVAPLMPAVQSAAFQALQLLKAGDEVCLFTFAGDVEMLEELTPNRQRVANRIGGIRAGGGTAIVDAVSEALRYLDTAAHDRRRAVILISDNIEGHSSTPVERAIEFALESEAVVYSVRVGAGSSGGAGLPGLPGIPGISRLPGLGSSSDLVREITKETGGEIFDATGGGSIAAALTTAVDRLKLRYTLSYASEKSGLARSAKGGYHRIQVKLVSRFGRADTDYTIHSRSGYYDPPVKTNFAEALP